MTQLFGRLTLTLVAAGLLGSPVLANPERQQPVARSVEINIDLFDGPYYRPIPRPIIIRPRPRRYHPGWQRFGPGWVNICGYPTNYAGCYAPDPYYKVTSEDLQTVQDDINGTSPEVLPIFGSDTLQTIVDNVRIMDSDLGMTVGPRLAIW